MRTHSLLRSDRCGRRAASASKSLGLASAPLLAFAAASLMAIAGCSPNPSSPAGQAGAGGGGIGGSMATDGSAGGADAGGADAGGAGGGGQGGAAPDVDCSSSANPLRGTCVETFFASGCFDGSGACTDRSGMGGSGLSDTTAWANGAKVVISLGASGEGAITVSSSSGATCFSGVATLSTTQGCEERTDYSNPAGKHLVVCGGDKDESSSFTCDDGTTVTLSAGQSAYGSCLALPDTSGCQ